ncbi:hypothetical protein FHX42_001112 [Saccharopolyspora lacisalsi]|uniref:Uncharacterized protein n=1 Tax=Halosaccharopolyspora lacisalsi TaxID=1000566 RepID=A0A839DRT4_9PSEU|nr:hypothetical protein [Halosaccharopolyspora lacisalsi]MBA8823783.1 hypothetical protein [Halosaccharopolyspora lacisalsi]
MSNPPVFDAFLYRALRKVARSEIGAAGATGTLRHRTDELSSRLISALFMLRRDGYVQLAHHTTSTDEWVPAELTLAGTQLLGQWMRTHTPSRAERSTAVTTSPPRRPQLRVVSH